MYWLTVALLTRIVEHGVSILLVDQRLARKGACDARNETAEQIRRQHNAGALIERHI